MLWRSAIGPQRREVRRDVLVVRFPEKSIEVRRPVQAAGWLPGVTGRLGWHWARAGAVARHTGAKGRRQW